MISTRIIVIGGLLTCLSVLFQSVPILFSEVLVFVTILSALPIYIIAKISPKAGAAGYIIAAILIMFLSAHEGLFFLCSNGIVGLSLGVCHHYTNKKLTIYAISSAALTIALSVMNFVIGIPVFGMKMPYSIYIQLGILLLFSWIYIIFYFYIANFFFKIINKMYKI